MRYKFAKFSYLPGSERCVMRKPWHSVLAGILGVIACNSAASAQGLFAGGSGAMNRSMAGASTAVGVDALGAMYWNPAAISGLPGSEVVIGSELILPDVHLSS